MLFVNGSYISVFIYILRYNILETAVKISVSFIFIIKENISGETIHTAVIAIYFIFGHSKLRDLK